MTGEGEEIPSTDRANSPKVRKTGGEEDKGEALWRSPLPSSSSSQKSGARMLQESLQGTVTGEGGERPEREEKYSPKEAKRRGKISKLDPPVMDRGDRCILGYA